MSKMRELFKICPKIQFFELSSCFQDCRGGAGENILSWGVSLIKSVKGGILLFLGKSEKFSV